LGFDEVVVSTYSGWVSGLTTEQMQKKVTAAVNDAALSTAEMDEDTQRKLDSLRYFLAWLRFRRES